MSLLTPPSYLCNNYASIVPDTVLYALEGRMTLLLLVTSCAILSSSLYTEEMETQGVTLLAWSHTGGKWQRRDSDPIVRLFYHHIMWPSTKKSRTQPCFGHLSMWNHTFPRMWQESQGTMLDNSKWRTENHIFKIVSLVSLLTNMGNNVIHTSSPRIMDIIT